MNKVTLPNSTYNSSHISVKIDLSDISDKINEGITDFRDTLKARAIKDLDPYVPYDTGVLANTAKTENTDSGFDVIYEAPYSAFAYNSKGKFSKTTHPLAQSHWDSPASTANMKEWERLGSEEINK